MIKVPKIKEAGMASKAAAGRYSTVNTRRRWWLAADALFKPRNLYLEADDEMDMLYKIRALLGVALIGGIGWYYHGARSLPQEADDWVKSMYFTALFTPAAILFSGAYLIVATRQRRWAALWQLRWPLLTFTTLAASGLIVQLMLHGPLFVKHIDQRVGRNWAVPVNILWFLFLVWMLVYFLRALYLAAGSLCRARDGHPLIGPIVAPVIAVAVTIQSLISGPGGSAAPSNIQLLMLLGAPASITCLSIAEIARLRVRYQGYFPFRNGPPSQPLPLVMSGPGDTYSRAPRWPNSSEIS